MAADLPVVTINARKAESFPVLKNNTVLNATNAPLSKANVFTSGSIIKYIRAKKPTKGLPAICNIIFKMGNNTTPNCFNVSITVMTFALMPAKAPRISFN